MRGSGSEEWKDEEQQKEASTTPPLTQPNPQGWGTRRKKQEAKSKPAPPANGLGRRLAIAIAFRV